MVRVCCVTGCNNSWTPNCDISFFGFPLKNENLLDQWKEVIPTRYEITKYTTICSDHFSNASCTFKNGKRFINKDAIPTIFHHTALQLEATGADTSTEKSEKSFPVSQPCVGKRRRENYTALRDITPIAEGNYDFALTEQRKSNPTKPATMTANETCVDRDTQTSPVPAEVQKHAATQTSPRRLPPSEMEEQLRYKIKLLTSRLHRRESKISTMTELLSDLRKDGNLTEDLEEIFLKRFSGLNMDLFRNEIENTKQSKFQSKYSDKVKEFASTLYFYSPKAYAYVRTALHLPHEGTLRKWVGELSCEAGFLSCVFNFLQVESETNGHMKDVGLIFDAMSIRKQVLLDRKDFVFKGFVDYGSAAEELHLNIQCTDLAKEVLAFQIVSYSKQFKIPIAHFFVNGISAENQSTLLLAAITKLYSVGVLVRSITCDGAAVNFRSLTKLGCNFNVEELKTSFKHPLNDSEIHVILDPCHLIKLCRTCFAEHEILTPTVKTSFAFVKKLNEIQKAEGFKFANRLSSCHINYKDKKMKVSLATQTVSSGVADAIDFLRAGSCSEFHGSEATVEFLRVFDRIFDMLNTRNAFGKGYKSPLSLQNFTYWNEVFNDTNKFIEQLSIDGRPILKHQKKCFALGFIIDIESFRNLALDLLRNTQNPLKYLSTYKCSQDHIELYFCCLRARGGWNNNPSVMQVLWAVRRLLYRNSVQPSINSNCLSGEFENSSILEFRSQKRALCHSSFIDNDDDTEKCMTMLHNSELYAYQKNILYYITGNIVRKFKNQCNCVHCCDILVSTNVRDHQYSVNVGHNSAFLEFVNRGGLCIPSEIAFKIVEFCEKVFLVEMNIGFMGSTNLKNRITAVAVKHFLPRIQSLFKPTHPIVETIDSLGELHEMKIIKFICATYSIIQLNAYAKSKTLEYVGHRANMRQKLHNTILFHHI